MFKLLKGMNAVVTGASRGIGRAIVHSYAKEGANVWVILRQKNDALALDQGLQTLAVEMGVEIWPIYADLSRPDEIKRAANEILSAKKPIDILVNNAAIIFTALFQMTSMEKFHEIFETDFFSPMLLTQYLVKAMTRQKSGSIIHLSSSAAIEGNEGRVAYASAKAALISATKVMARELGPIGIRVNAIAPGLTLTEMMEKSTPKTALETTIARTCLRRVGKPEEIAATAVFLASPLSSYISGQVIRVDGGM
jgi:3-oxoacyl-[acyl-carrier protein] reductase